MLSIRAPGHSFLHVLSHFFATVVVIIVGVVCWAFEQAGIIEYFVGIFDYYIVFANFEVDRPRHANTLVSSNASSTEVSVEACRAIVNAFGCVVVVISQDVASAHVAFCYIIAAASDAVRTTTFALGVTCAVATVADLLTVVSIPADKLFVVLFVSRTEVSVNGLRTYRAFIFWLQAFDVNGTRVKVMHDFFPVDRFYEAQRRIFVNVNASLHDVS